MLKRWIICSAVGCGLLLGSGCGTSGETASETAGAAEPPTTTDGIADAAWRLATNRNFQAGLTFAGTNGTLTLLNESGVALESPTLFLFDTTTGTSSSVIIAPAEPIADGATWTGTFAYPGAAEPDATAYFGLQLGDATVGRFYTTATFAEFPVAITAGAVADATLSPVTAKAGASPTIPSSGTWNFSMTGDLSSLSGANCPTSGSGGLLSAGTATLSVDCDGLTADLDVDMSHLALNLVSTSAAVYRSPTYSFPVADGDAVVSGSNYFDFTAASTAAIAGELHWDNSLGCTATYPITMTLQSASNTTVHDLCTGAWTLSYNAPVVCGATPLLLSSLPAAPAASGTLSTIDIPSGLPLAFNYATATGSIYLFRQGCTNNYGNLLVPFLFGATIDSFGNPLVFGLAFQATATSPTEMFGFGMLIGTGATTNCAVSFPFTLTAASGC
ncbi:MAG: hypothetical protein HY696_04105 [Deltaproteobacteria bacterium]|nr:hypothetical protein [Deltaproteobacteria bacterium]